MNDIAEKFWANRKKYPPVTHNFERRYIDLWIILSNIDSVGSIVDIGCGEGQLILMLRELTAIKEFYAYDISSVFIDNLVKRWGDWPGLHVRKDNIVTCDTFPLVDMSVCMGAMLYITDDTLLSRMLRRINSGKFICRVPCSMDGSRVEINKYSEEFGAEYSAVYRTVEEYSSILSIEFDIIEKGRCYPDSIESKYGTKQFFFVCSKKND